MKRFFAFLLGLTLLPALALAAVFNSSQVGSSPSNGYYLQTNGTVSTWAAVSTGAFATSTNDYWISQYSKGFFFATSSADYWGSTKGYLTSSASTTFATDNYTVTGKWNFGNATSTLFTSTTAWITTLNLTNALTVGNGGTGATTLTGLLLGNGTGAITGGATINNSNWSGTDLAVGNGGTGLSTFGGTNTILYTTSADTLSSSAGFTFNPTGTLLTAVNASTTNLTVGSYMENPRNILPIAMASSTWSVGTTTITLMQNVRAITILDASCPNDTGLFLGVDIYYSTTHLNYLISSSTANTITFSTNNVVAAGSKIQMAIGTSTAPATGLKWFNCTLEYVYNGSG